MTLEYQSLMKTYDGFTAPSAEITVGGKDLISTDSCVVTSLKVSLSCSKKAGMAVFQIEAEPEDTSLSKLLKAGEKVSVKLGYKGENKLVFLGYVHMASESRSYEGVSYEAVCLDCKGLMSQEVCSLCPDGKKLDAVIKDILTKSRYSDFYEATQIGSIPKPFENDTVQFALSDREFLERTAERHDFCFFVREDKLVFDKEVKSTDTVKLDYENGIISVTSRSDLTNQAEKVTFLGADDDGKSINASAQSKSKLKPAGTKTVYDPRSRTKDELTSLAEAMVSRIDKEAYTFEADCIGLPELLPMNSVKTKTAELEIREAVHTFDDFGYRVAINGAVKG